MRVFASYVQRCRIQYGTSGPKTVTQFFNVMNIIWTRFCLYLGAVRALHTNLVMYCIQKPTPEGSATARLGVRDFEIHWISSGFRISEWISGFQSGFLDFKVDFWISKWISGFQSGFLDFKVDFSRDFWISSEFLDFKADFWISKWISRGITGFQANFWISKRISGFHLNRYYSKIQLKYTHYSSTAFLSACMLTEYKVTGTSPLHSAQAACSLIVIHIRIL